MTSHFSQETEHKQFVFLLLNPNVELKTCGHMISSFTDVFKRLREMSKYAGGGQNPQKKTHTQTSNDIIADDGR